MSQLSLSVQQIEAAIEFPIYPKRDITINRGNGAVLFDSDGKKYLDFVAGIGVANIGHSHPRIVQVITKQASQLITCPEIFSNDTRSKLLLKLNEITPDQLNQVYLCNSGTESVEAAIKFARASTNRTKIIASMRSFHGRTMGSLSVTFNQKYRKPFSPLIPDVQFVPFNKIKQLEEQIDHETAAIILEVIQGNGGIHIAEQSYLRRVRELCDEYGVLLILDEVQTGFCRTGSMFAFEQYDVVPDILCLAKAMGGGIPIGATIVNSDKVTLGKSLHGSTFGGNPLAAAVALETISIMEDENLADKSRELGNYLVNRLHNLELSIIRDIRNVGLMVGVELRVRVYPVLRELQDRGILANPAGSTVIRLLPPLVISKKQIDSFVDIFHEVLKEIV